MCHFYLICLGSVFLFISWSCSNVYNLGFLFFCCSSSQGKEISASGVFIESFFIWGCNRKKVFNLCNSAFLLKSSSWIFSCSWIFLKCAFIAAFKKRSSKNSTSEGCIPRTPIAYPIKFSIVKTALPGGAKFFFLLQLLLQLKNLSFRSNYLV